MSKLDALEHFQLAMTELSQLMDDINKPFSIRDKTINHPAYNETVRRIATLHRRGKELKQGGGLLVTGHSGIGKTKVLNFYRDEFPAYDDCNGAVIPVLYVVTPAEPTVKNLAEAILSAMRDPFSFKGTSAQKTNRIYLMLEKCGVELLMIDEFQHFADTCRRSASSAVTDWLKNLLNVAKIPVVLAGLPHCESVIHGNPQLARRFSSRNIIKPFSYDAIEAIKPIGQLPNKVGLGKLIFMEDEVRHVINETRTIEPNHWSVPQVAEMLNIKQEVAYFLVRQGLLESNSEVIGRRESAVVTREGLNAFRTKYVFARDLAKLHRTNSRSLQARLAEINIQPVTSPLAGKCRQIIYEQTLALIRLFPMSANHASPMMAISP